MTTRLEKLNRAMLSLEHNGDLSEEDYGTYKELLNLESDARLVVDRWESGDLAAAVCQLSVTLEELK